MKDSKWFMALAAMAALLGYLSLKNGPGLLGEEVGGQGNTNNNAGENATTAKNHAATLALTEAEKIKKAQAPAAPQPPAAAEPSEINDSLDAASGGAEKDPDSLASAGDATKKVSESIARRLTFIHGREIDTFAGLRNLSLDELKKSPLKHGSYEFVTGPFAIRRHTLRFGFVIDIENSVYNNRLCYHEESAGNQEINYGYSGVPYFFGVSDGRIRSWLPQANPDISDVRFTRYVLDFPTATVVKGERGKAQLWTLNRGADGQTWAWSATKKVEFWNLADEATPLTNFVCNWNLLYHLN